MLASGEAALLHYAQVGSLLALGTPAGRSRHTQLRELCPRQQTAAAPRKGVPLWQAAELCDRPWQVGPRLHMRFSTPSI